MVHSLTIENIRAKLRVILGQLAGEIRHGAYRRRAFKVKIAMTGIHVKDPKVAFKFYTEILGFVEHTYMPEANLAIVVSPDDAEGTALLLEPSDNPVAK